MEWNHFSTSKTAMRYPNRRVTRDEFLEDVRNTLLRDEELNKVLQTLPGGIYIFGHSHVQWHLQVGDHLFINPGSCGIPLDCTDFGAPYTLLTVEKGTASVQERRVKYEPNDIIEQVKNTDQYKKARVWSEVIFEEWLSCREKIYFFLQFAEEYAREIGDVRRPIAKDTWEEAFHRWYEESGR